MENRKYSRSNGETTNHQFHKCQILDIEIEIGKGIDFVMLSI